MFITWFVDWTCYYLCDCCLVNWRPVASCVFWAGGGPQFTHFEKGGNEWVLSLLWGLWYGVRKNIAN
jgi:hypothetical protein